MRRWWRGGSRRTVVELGLLALGVVVVAGLVRAFLVQPLFIASASMTPTLEVHDQVVVSKVAYDLHGIRRGDLIVFAGLPSGAPATGGSPPAGPGRILRAVVGDGSGRVDLVKRVVGLPGDRVAARGGKVYLDGRPLAEPYLPLDTPTSTFGPVVVPPHHLWVLGDDRTDSDDSRVFGPLPRSTVVGQVVLRFWPPGRIGIP
ncbi:MAG TPA: signal peptidase I [Acidimicrobiales bacterium]|nr:signal peptidase I [Acidimicrobiales bacterium]